MSTVVYQGLQSQLIDSRTLKLKLASQPKPYFCPSFELELKSLILDSDSMKLMKEKQHPQLSSSEDILTSSTINNNNLSSSIIIPNLDGWAFLPTLPNITQTSNEIKQTSYVHSPSKISPTPFGFKSLELCTENLGSETGTEIVEDDAAFSFTCSDNNGSGRSNSGRKELYSRRCRTSESKKKIKTFPPPLTTMRGTDYLRVRPHREEGRLVINAVKTPIKSSCFQAERSSGRLRLRFVENNNGAELNTSDDDNEQNEAKSESHNDNDNKFENDDQLITNQEYQVEKEEDNEDALCLNEDVDGNKLDSGAKTEMGKFQRQSSRMCMCKEGGNRNKDGLLNLEACWVATS